MDIICVQESHVTESDISTWKKEWGDEIVYFPGTSMSKGQMILLNSKKGVKLLEVVHRSERIVAIKIAYEDEQILICNIYAPNDGKEKISFMDKLYNLIEEWSDNITNLCIMGDFNMVMNNDIDIISGLDHKKEEVEMFKRKMVNLNLYDTWRLFNPDNKEYTWHRKSPMIARRLDYIFSNSDLFDKIISCEIMSAPATDHRAVIAEVQFTQVKRGPYYWKFNNSLLKDIEYVNGVHELIDGLLGDMEQSENDYQLLWDLCKIRIREFSIQFSKEKAKQFKSRIHWLSSKVDDLHKKIAQSPGNMTLVNEMEKTRMELDLAHVAKSKGAQVRAKVNWIENGEKCTKYFLNLEKSRAGKKIITRLKKQDGEVTCDQKEILNIQYEFYKDLYHGKVDFSQNEDILSQFIDEVQIPKLSEEDQLSCEGLITTEEAWLALKCMKNGSAPGSDGLTVEFYKCFWRKLKLLVVRSFNAAFESGSLSVSQRRGILTLLHKGKELPREELTNWRPITLTNSDYKILAKTLALRLQKVIKEIVGEEQCGYIKGRNISTLIRMVDDIIEKIDNDDEQGALLALDYSKAFDSISKQYMLKVFSLFGFGEQFIKWVDVLNNGTESSILYCGWQSKRFPINTGIRQGCPFSPLAFILGVELLALKIKQCNEIIGIPLSSGGSPQKAKIVQYADDTTLLLKDENDVNHALQIVELFSKFSGLKLNKKKTMGMWIGRKKHDMNGINGIQWRSGAGARIKILGVFFSNNEKTSEISENWEEKIVVMLEKIKRWEKRDLSIYGKICIIKTFLISQVVYLMQSLLMPNSVVDRINQIIFRFLWKKKFNNRKAFEKVKRKVMCTDYTEGGLKMINIDQMKKSFLLNWIGKLSTDSKEPWKVIPTTQFNKLGKDMSVFYSSVSSQKFEGMKQIKSVFWQSVLQVWLDNNEIQKDTNMANQVIWNNREVLYRNKCLCFTEWIKCGIVYIKDIIRNREIVQYERIVDMVGPAPHRMFEYNALKNALLRNWRLTGINGGYYEDGELRFCGKSVLSLKSKDYRDILINKTKVKPCAANFWERKYNLPELGKQFWNIPFKCTKEARLRTLQWKIFHNIYPTRILLKKMSVANSDLCLHCGEREYIEHFFFECEEMRSFWNYVEKEMSAIIGKNIKLQESEVILGITKGYSLKILNLINLFILVGKMCISKIKYGAKRNIKLLFEFEINIRKSYWCKFIEV